MRPGTANEIAALGIRRERPLEGVQFFLGQEFGDLPGEDGRFLEGEPHAKERPSMTECVNS